MLKLKQLLLNEVTIPGLTKKVQVVLPNAGGKLKLSSTQLAVLVRACAVSLLDPAEIKMYAYKTTVPEYAQDYVLAYNNIVEILNKPKILKSDLLYIAKVPFKELFVFGNECDKSSNIQVSKFGVKLSDALWVHPRNITGI